MSTTLSVHSTTGFIFSAFGLLHIAHHLYGAFYGSAAHQAMQERIMGDNNLRSQPARLALELALVLLPAASAWLSGLMLLRKHGPRGAFTAVSSLARLLFSGSLFFPPSESTARVAIKNIQIASASALGVFLFMHSCAVLGFRFLFRSGVPVNYESASHHMWHLPFAHITGKLFGSYYVLFTTAFFAHMASSIAEQRSKASSSGIGKVKKCDDADNAEAAATAAAASVSQRNSSSRGLGAKSWLRLFVLPMTFVGLVAGLLIVFRGMMLHTSKESTEGHLPF
jgi:hypothetical protein